MCVQFFWNKYFEKTCQLFSWEKMSQNMLKLWLRFFWKNQFEGADWTSSYKGKIEQQLSIIEPILKKWNVRHLKFVHSKDRSNNCSICEFSFSTIDILKDMPIIFMRTGCQKTCTSCEYDSSEKFNSKEHTEPIHIKKILNNSSVCDHGYSQKRKKCENTLNLFIQKIR